MGLQIVITFGIFLSILGFAYFLKSRSAVKAVVSGKKEEATEPASPSTKVGLRAKILSNWQAKDLEQKRWFLYIWLMVIAILVVYAVPGINKDYEEKRFYIGGIVVLLGLHFVIWPFFTEKTSMSTKIVATAVFLFLIAAVLAPNAAVRVTKVADEQVDNFDKYAFNSASSVTESTTLQSSSSSQQLKQTIIASPGDEFQKVNIPSGKRIDKISFSCTVPGTGAPNGCIVRILHKGDLICTKGMYKGVYCGYDIAVDGRKPLYDEQFELTKDANVAFPEDLFQVIYMVATTSEFGPAEIKTTTAISD